MRLNHSRSIAAIAVMSSIVTLTVYAQSTQGSLLGSVKDATGAAISGATVRITNTDTGSISTDTSGTSGEFHFINLNAGKYQIEVSASGFNPQTLKNLRLTARQELRADAVLSVGSLQQETTVDANAAGTIETDSASIDATLSATEVRDLPANYRASSNGTSPLNMIQSLPGVQSDASGNGNQPTFSVQGGLPFQTDVTVDGITTRSATGGNSPIQNAFPSGDSIAEMRVDGVLNPAEFGQPGEVTTTTKSGTNALHGGIFWYHQDSALNATPFGSLTKPKLVTNDYGATLGGPVFIPHLYNGHNRTFFFGTYEGYRSPRTSPYEATVPTAAMKRGDFTRVQGTTSLTSPTGAPYTLSAVPVNPVAQKFLQFFPDPNFGDTSTFVPGAINYKANKDTSLFSNQFDVRGDQYFGQKALVFARFTWKNYDQNAVKALAVPSSKQTYQDRIFLIAGNYNFTPNLVNEFRYGFTFDTNGNTNAFDGRAFTDGSGLQGLQNLFYNGIPELDFGNLTSLDADRLTSQTKSRTHVFVDNLTWVKGRHSMKLGLDIRRLQAVTPLGFNGSDNYGTFGYSQALFTGNEFADFLIGTPSTTFYDVVQSDNDGRAMHYHFYAQDQWRVSDQLTLSYGLRYEYHPAYHDPSGNIGNFDPSVAKSGRVVYPTGKGALVSQPYLSSFNSCGLGQTTGVGAQNGAACTPTVDNTQAGLPDGLRTAIKLRFAPRFGFAWRPFGGNRTVVRGGYGLYNITLLGSNFYSLTGTLQANTVQYSNIKTAAGAAYAWPQIFAGAGSSGGATFGQAYFGTANDIHWKDPYSHQFSLSVERDLGKGYGLRVSYIGMTTKHLVWAPNLNDMPYSKTTSAFNQPLSARPFPNWGVINTRSTGASSAYHSGQVDFRHAVGAGLTFDTTYTFAKNLSNNQGPNSNNFASESGGARASWAGSPDVDFGQVAGTRRHRWNTTLLYALPVGRGKQFGGNMNRIADLAVGGWQLSSIFLVQTGPFLSPYFPGGQGDPSGTGSGLSASASGGALPGRDQKADRVLVNPFPASRNAAHWFNPAAFACPGTPTWTPGSQCHTGRGQAGDAAPIGRFGNLQNNSIVGPGTVNLSAGLSKNFAITERIGLRVEGTFTNILNKTNFNIPNLNLSSGAFGQITSAANGDFGAARTGQVSARIQF